MLFYDLLKYFNNEFLIQVVDSVEEERFVVGEVVIK